MKTRKLWVVIIQPTRLPSGTKKMHIHLMCKMHLPEPKVLSHCSINSKLKHLILISSAQKTQISHLNHLNQVWMRHRAWFIMAQHSSPSVNYETSKYIINIQNKNGADIGYELQTFPFKREKLEGKRNCQSQATF